MPENAAEPSGPSGEGAPKPSRIGGFELLATLGKGGMGTVLKARQISMDRVVALKVLPPNLAKNQDFVQRFLREARSAAKLNHPNIVQGIDVGEADGVYYFAMEFVDGPTLKDLLKREGRLDEKKALNIIGGVARALEHAHKHGIVHRDIKPDNIMISRDGTALGTPHYMAPEQARGEADLDTRCDIYALGATLFHAVTGEFPYTAPNAGALMAKHITEPVPNPKDRNSALSRPICDLIQHMMAKDREDRPQTPTDLLAEIRDALEGKIKLRSAATLPTHRPSPRPGGSQVHSVHSVHPPNRRSARPWLLAAAAVLAAGALFLVLRPGGTAKQQAKEEDDRTAKAAKIAKDEKIEKGKTSPPAAKTEPEPGLDKEIAALKSQCDDLVAKGQFGPALARLGAFAANLPKVSNLREGILSAAGERYAALARAADDAIEKKDFPSARAALKPAEAFGIPDLADRAKKKLEEIASREKSAEAWAKWDATKAEAKKLIDAAKLDEAAKLLDGAKAIPLDHMADVVAEQMQSIASTKSTLLKAVLAAYAAESDKVWALVKERKYAEADKLLADLAASLPKVSNLREGIGGRLQADQEAAKLLKEFWTAVEKGLGAKAGQFVSFRGAAGGTLVAVQDGNATIKTPKGEEPRRVHDLVAKQALAHADLKDDPHSHLLKGVFLLAEGQDMETAEKALAAAGDAPEVAVFKDRLDRALGREKAVAKAKDAEGREAAAGAAWRALVAASKGDLTHAQAKRALASAEAFEGKYGTTQFAEGVRDELATLRPRLEELAEGATAKPDAEPAANEAEQGLLAAYYTGRNMEKFVAAKPLSGALDINWGFGGPPYRVFLAKGFHRLWVECYDVGGPAYVTLQWHEAGEPVPVPADRFFCERKLLDAVRLTPNRNLLAGMRPMDRVRPPVLKAAPDDKGGK